MKIHYLKVNHLVNPMGYDLAEPTISYVVEETGGKRQAKAQVLVARNDKFTELVYDSGEREDIVSTAYVLPFVMEPETRYYWKVRVWTDNGETGESETAWFETPKGGGWKADWITPSLPKEVQAVLTKKDRYQEAG